MLQRRSTDEAYPQLKRGHTLSQEGAGLGVYFFPTSSRPHTPAIIDASGGDQARSLTPAPGATRLTAWMPLSRARSVVYISLVPITWLLAARKLK